MRRGCSALFRLKQYKLFLTPPHSSVSRTEVLVRPPSPSERFASTHLKPHSLGCLMKFAMSVV